MDGSPVLTMSVYIGASLVFALVIFYWVLYTRRLKTPRNVGIQEGIAMAEQRKERSRRSGTIG